MFKKTPIASAILALSVGMNVAFAENNSSGAREFLYVNSSGQISDAGGHSASLDLTTKDYPTVEVKGPQSDNNGTVNLKDIRIANANSDSNASSSHLVLNDFRKLNLTVSGDNQEAIYVGHGSLNIGVAIKANNPDGYISEPKEDCVADPLEYFSVYSKNGPAILGDATVDNADLHIIAKETVIESGSEDHAAVSLGGRGEGLDSGDRSSLKIKGYQTQSLSHVSEDDAKNADQTVTIIGVKKAIELKDGAHFSDFVGSLDITGSVFLENAASFNAGFRFSSQLNDAKGWLDDWDWKKDKDSVRLLKSLNIQATDEDLVALSLKKGSSTTLGAKNITISGVKGKNEQFSTAIYIDTGDSNVISQNTNRLLPTMVTMYATDNLTINGDIVIERGHDDSHALIDIYSEDVLEINGNIYIKNKQRTQNTLNLTLSGEKQYFRGSIIDDYGEASTQSISEEDVVETETPIVARYSLRSMPLMLTSQKESIASRENLNPGTQVRLRNGAFLDLIDDSVISTLNAKNSTVSIGENSLTIKTLRTKTQGVTTFETSGVQKNQIVVEKRRYRPSSNFTSGNPLNDLDGDLGTLHVNVNEAKYTYSEQELASMVSFGTIDTGKFTLEQEILDKAKSYSVRVFESGKTPGIVAQVDNGECTEYKVEDNTTVSKAINDVAGLGVLAWRAQMNDVNKRLGDLRTYQGQYGGWARVYGSESKYGDMGLKSESTTVQVGADMKFGNNFYFGATASYSDGEGKLNNGTTDDRSYSFGLYGGWMGDDGQFVDVIVKEANFKTDFDLRYTTGKESSGSFDLWGTSICAEYGWRLPVTNNVWVEPQAEITYGYMNDVSYIYSDSVKATQEATESLVGRLGVALGTTFDRGSAYVKASVAHDWMGETEISMSNGNAPMKEDLGGTWGEFAIGGTYNFANGWAVYGELQTAKGSKMKTPYQNNIGARYIF